MSEDTEERWLTYAELGAALGCTPNAARMHAVRRHWPRRAPNRIGGQARVLVPEDALVQARAIHGAAPFVTRERSHNNGTGAVEHGELIAAIREFVTPLREQLEHERRRADDATAAERIAAREAAALRAELERRREWSLWRRLRWALRGE